MLKAKARVRVTVEIDVENRWHDNCPISEIYQISKPEAVSKLLKSIDLKEHLGIYLVGEPKVLAIIVEED